MQIHLHKAFFSDDRFLDSLHKSFLNQTTLDLRKEKWTFLNRRFTVVQKKNQKAIYSLINDRTRERATRVEGFYFAICYTVLGEFLTPPSGNFLVNLFG